MQRPVVVATWKVAGEVRPRLKPGFYECMPESLRDLYTGFAVATHPHTPGEAVPTSGAPIPASEAAAAPSLKSPALREVERYIASTFKDVKKDLVDHPENREVFFQHLRRYFGERFSRESYDAILNQLDLFLAEVPDLSKRLLETRVARVADFEVVVPPVKTERGVNRGPLRVKLEAIQKALDEVIHEGGAPDADAAKALWNEAREAVVAAQASPSKTDLPDLTRKLQADKPFTAALARLLKDAMLGAGQVAERLRSQDAATVLETLADLRQGVGVIPRRAGGALEVPDRILGNRFGSLLGAKNALEEDNALFPPLLHIDSKAGRRLNFVEGHPLLWIFRGAPINACTGGGKAFLGGGSLTGDDYLIAALRGTVRKFVESHPYKADPLADQTPPDHGGHVQLVPFRVKGQEPGHFYLSIEPMVWSFGLRAEAEGVPTDVLSVALSRQLPEGCDGIVVGKLPDGFNNTQGEAALGRSLQVALSRPIGQRDDVHLFDPHAKLIPTVGPPRKSHALSYVARKSMITPVTKNSNDTLRVLQRVGLEDLRDLDNVVELFRRRAGEVEDTVVANDLLNAVRKAVGTLENTSPAWMRGLTDAQRAGLAGALLQMLDGPVEVATVAHAALKMELGSTSTLQPAPAFKTALETYLKTGPTASTEQGAAFLADLASGS